MTLLILILIAAVAGLGWLLLMQRQRVLTAHTPVHDQSGLALQLASITTERHPGRPAPTGEDLMDLGTTNAASVPAGDGAPSLFARGEANDLRQQWNAIQASFVDEPRAAVEEADRLVAGAVQRLSEAFAAERQSLSRDSGVSTEDLRLTLQRYKSHLARLLAI